MMKLQAMRVGVLGLLLGIGAGCGGSYSGVQAIAPAAQEKLVGVTPDAGQYTLYQATGYIENHDPNVRPVWTVSLSAGQRIGFRWETDQAHRYAPSGAFHLIAFAGSRTRDLGAFRAHDLKYVWAGAHADVNGYFQGQGVKQTLDTLTMQ